MDPVSGRAVVDPMCDAGRRAVHATWPQPCHRLGIEVVETTGDHGVPAFVYLCTEHLREAVGLVGLRLLTDGLPTLPPTAIRRAPAPAPPATSPGLDPGVDPGADSDQEVAWTALTLLRLWQDGDRVDTAEFAKLRTRSASARAAAVVEISATICETLQGHRGRQLTGPLDDVLARLGSQDLARAAVLAVRAHTHPPADLDRTMADWSEAAWVEDAPVPDDDLDRRLQHLALNSLSLIAARLGLADQALRLTAVSQDIEFLGRVGVEQQDSRPAAVNEVLVRVEQALLPRLDRSPPGTETLLAVRAMIPGLLASRRIVGARQEAVRIAWAVVEAYLDPSSRAWASLAAMPAWDSNTFLIARRLWVCAATRCATALVQSDPAEVGPVLVAREAHRRLLQQDLVVSNLDLVASAERLALERTVRRLGLPDEVEEVLDLRDRQSQSLLRMHQVALQTTVRSHLLAGELRQQNRVLAVQAHVDELTGLGNRRDLDETLTELSAGLPHAPVGVVVLDVDDFKTINDELGHLAGDVVLTRVAAGLRDALGPDDRLFRFGGDEFVVLMPDADEIDCLQRAKRLVAAVDLVLWDDIGPGLSVTLSVGTSAGTDVVHRLLARADHDLLEQKRNRRRRADDGS